VSQQSRRYRVRVELITEERKEVRGDWVTLKVTGEGPSREEQRGYAPAIEKAVVERTDIYDQTVESLDMGKLVAVVNCLDQVPRQATAP
jgi:hypothetical protein